MGRSHACPSSAVALFVDRVHEPGHPSANVPVGVARGPGWSARGRSRGRVLPLVVRPGRGRLSGLASPPVSSLGGPVLAFSLSPRWAVRDSNPRPLARHASVYVLVGTLQSSDQCLSDLLRLLRWLKSPASVGTSVGTLFPSISCWTSPAKLHGRTHRGNRTPRSPTPGQSQGMSPNPRAVEQPEPSAGRVFARPPSP